MMAMDGGGGWCGGGGGGSTRYGGTCVGAVTMGVAHAPNLRTFMHRKSAATVNYCMTYVQTY